MTAKEMFTQSVAHVLEEFPNFSKTEKASLQQMTEKLVALHADNKDVLAILSPLKAKF